jgi:transcription initiation factor TFIIH subunit 1
MSKIEDVLLVLPEVKFKKSDGSLYIMKERIAFIVDNRETVLVSHSFYDVKSKLLLLPPRAQCELNSSF